MFQRSGASANSGEGGTIPLCLVPGRAASRTASGLGPMESAAGGIHERSNQVRPHEALAMAVTATALPTQPKSLHGSAPRVGIPPWLPGQEIKLAGVPVLEGSVLLRL